MKTSASGRLFLVGFMGAGKTTVGERLAQVLERDFIDLDAVLEANSGLSIAALFEQHGEAWFRKMEAAALRSLRDAPAVIATGGGTPCFHGNMAWMNAAGTTVFIDPGTEQLKERLRGATHRPKIAAMPEEAFAAGVEALHAARRPFYEAAQLRIANDAGSADGCVLRILELLSLAVKPGPAAAPGT